jgi:hypothetical protein
MRLAFVPDPGRVEEPDDPFEFARAEVELEALALLLLDEVFAWWAA